MLKCSGSARVRAAVCWRASSWRCTAPDVSIPCLFFWMTSLIFSVLQHTYDVILASCCVNYTTSTILWSQKQLQSALLQSDYICLIFSTSLVNVWACTALNDLWCQHSRFHHLSYVVSVEFIAVVLKESKSKNYEYQFFFAYPWTVSE
jgi:hypothetical protein